MPVARCGSHRPAREYPNTRDILNRAVKLLGVHLLVALTACHAEREPPAPAEVSPVSASPAPTTPPVDEEPVLTAEGWGPLRIGMTRGALVDSIGEDANPNAVGGPEPEVCDEFRPERAPTGMIVMIERDTLTRITLTRGSTVETEDGFAVGDAADEVERALSPGAAVTPHKYIDAPARYITRWSVAPSDQGDPRGIVYEAGADGVITHIHAGGASIQYVEGCL